MSMHNDFDGFSINLITLFALVLAIGIVVDDAIVVVEAVHAKMEENHIDAKAATELAMKEIGGAIIAITLVMAAVFIPVAFLPGPTGIFYRQFSITMASSIVICPRRQAMASAYPMACCAVSDKSLTFDNCRTSFRKPAAYIARTRSAIRACNKGEAIRNPGSMAVDGAGQERGDTAWGAAH